jgi:predicted Zn finger-like uncharacterized protein
MALAARCPHCQAAFRVVADQLKLRGGLVRCGDCRRVFDAIATLTIVEETHVPVGAVAGIEPASPLLRAGAAAEVEVTATTAALPRTDEPRFLQPSRRRRSAWALVGWSAATLLLGTLLAAQLSVAFSSEIVGRWPALHPALVQLCRHTPCQVHWPRRPELLTLLGADLEALPGTDALELAGTIRNRADFTVAAPAIELTLAEANNRIVVRKVITPAEYLGERGRGIDAGGELEFKIGFTAPGVKPESFVAYPFYPD